MKTYITTLTLSIFLLLNFSCTNNSDEIDNKIDLFYQEAINNSNNLIQASEIYNKKENEILTEPNDKESKAKLCYIDALYYKSINNKDSVMICLEKGFDLIRKNSDLKFNIALLAAQSAARIRQKDKMDIYYNYCNKRAQKTKNIVHLAQCKIIYALYYMSENKDSEAISFLQNADSLLKYNNINNYRDYYQYLLGYNYERQSFNTKAYEHYLNSLALCDSTKNNFRKLQNYQRIVSLYRKDKRFEEALKWQKEKLELVKQSNNLRLLRESYEGLGIIYTEMKDWNNGERYFQESLKYAKESKVKSGIATSLTNLGNFYYEKGNYKKAAQILEEVYNYKKTINASNSSLINTLNSLGKTYNALNNTQVAHKYLNESLQLTDSIESIHLKAVTNKHIYELYKKEKNFPEAIKYVTAYLKFEKENELRKSSDKLKKLMVEYETKEKDQQITMQKQELTNSRIIISALSFIVSLIIVIFILIILNKRVRQKAITTIYKQHIEAQHKQEIINNLIKERTTSNIQTNENRLLSNLLSLLDKEQVFKQQDLTLDLLAAKLNTNITYVSQIINKEFGCNFNTLINRYRISHCKKLIEGNKKDKLLMKQLGFDSGFASQSTF